MPTSSIIICGQQFDVGQRVITFQEDAKINAYTPHRTDDPSKIPPFQPAKGMAGAVERWRPRRLIGSDRSLERLKQVLRQFVIHHDGCQDSRTCFQVLHNERGLSVHFLIDNDGTIFQTLDLVDCAFQAAGVNEISIGVELANRGDALRFPNDYHGKRDKVTCKINGHQFLAYEYTKAQVESMISLGKALSRVFPNLPQVYPTAGGDEQSWATLGGDPRDYAGYLGHYHVTSNKWDPGPFDFKYFSSKIRGRMVFPAVLSGDKPDVPEDETKAEDLAQTYYDNNETDGQGGYFPVGPMGESRLWHGGMHIRAERGTPVYAPFSGKLVAARMTDDCPVGSRNFVLIRTDTTIGGAQIRFFTLLFHLDLETPGPNAPAWYNAAASQLGDDPVPLSIDVNAGDLVGHAGEAGPPGRVEGQVHVEIMSGDELGEKIEPGYWTLVDGSSSGRLCTATEIVGRIDKPSPGGRKDGLISRLELINFFRGNPDREGFRKMAVRHLSEWTDNNDWIVALNRAPDFAALKPAQRMALYRDQIQPVVWWTDDIGDAAGLPSDKIVWSYHPIHFIVWLHDKATHGKTTGSGIGDAGSFAGQKPPSDIKDDGDATEGFVDDEDTMFAKAKNLTLEDLANGYPDDDKKK
jgi:N-acetylmuramoyl-L-alanine amidase